VGMEMFKKDGLSVNSGYDLFLTRHRFVKTDRLNNF
jgi:hypothetical protein